MADNNYSDDSDTEDTLQEHCLSYWTIRRRVKASVEKLLTSVQESSERSRFENASDENNTGTYNSCNLRDLASEFNPCDQVEDMPISLNEELESECDDETAFHEIEHYDTDLFEGQYEYHYMYVSSSSDESDVENEEQEDFQDDLRDWAVECKIHHAGLNSLLRVLRKHADPQLPKDSRTLLKTVTKYDVKNICGGQYYHFGVKNEIVKQLQTCQGCYDHLTCLKVQINVDGLPLFKSTGGQFWPILGMVTNINLKEPHIYGLYYGKSKPTPVEDFLSDFIIEMKELMSEGIVYHEKHFSIELSSVICDTPARQFVKNIKAHNAYKGCDKCCQEGEYVNHRMTFPETDAVLRTDSQFAEMADEDHHKGESPFIELNIGMVTTFPLDYMHNICLGVMRRLIMLWLKGPLPRRIGGAARTRVSEYLISLQGFIPVEFSRKCRSLDDMDRWKATEFRLFLLYCGPVVLKDNLEHNVYVNFLTFHVAIRLLVSDVFCHEYCDYSHELLVTFVNEFGNLYGRDQIVYNVHAVTHIDEDVRLHGPLDSFSAFPFENFLGTLKKLVRKAKSPLQQVIRRISERECKRPIYQHKQNECGVRGQHRNGPVPVGYNKFLQYKQLRNEKYLITCSQGNNCVEINGRVALVRNLLMDRTNDDVTVVYEKFHSVSEFYSYPLDSTTLGIYLVKRPTGELHVTPATGITGKFVLLPYRDEYVAMPEL